MVGKTYNLSKIKKRISSLDGKLPGKDPYRALSDFHTQNAIGFYGESLIHRAFNMGDKSFTMSEILRSGDIVKEEDHGKVFSDGFNAVRKYFRGNSKAPGLALMYGGSIKVLMTGFDISKAVAIRMYAKFFSTLHVLKRSIDAREERAKEDLYVETLFGRRLFLPQLANPKTRGQGMTKIANSPIQGTASDQMKLAILKVSQWLEDCTLSKYQGNNLAKAVKGYFYNRIVCIEYSSIKSMSMLEKSLSRLEVGHTKVLILKGDTLYREWDSHVKLDYYTYEKYKMEIYH